MRAHATQEPLTLGSGDRRTFVEAARLGGAPIAIAAKAYAGRIRVENEKGEELPSESTSITRPRGPGILLVEDSPDDIELTMRAFRRHDPDQQVEVVQDGEKALEYLLGDPQRELPPLVILDLNLPKLSGIEVLCQVRAEPRLKMLPVVMLSTSGEPADVDRCYSSGANSYVRKPVDYQDFQELIGSVARYWLELNKRAY